MNCKIVTLGTSFQLEHGPTTLTLKGYLVEITFYFRGGYIRINSLRTTVLNHSIVTRL